MNEIVYLGQLISFENGIGKEIERRISLAWKNYWSLKSIYKEKLNIKTKTRIFESCTQSVLIYGAQTWTLTNKQLKRLNTTQRNMERSLVGVNKRDRVRNTDLRKRTAMIDAGYKIKKLKW